MALSRHLLLYADGSSSADGNFTLTGNFTIDCITNCIGVCIDDVCLPSPPLSPSSLPFEDGFKPTPVSFRSRDHLLPTLIIAVTSAVVGSFILLIALYSYFRCRRRRRRRPPLAPAPAADDSFIDGVDEPLPGSGEIEHHIWYIRTQGLDDSTISSIASWFYKSDDGIVDGKDCSVCLGDFIDGDLIRLLPKCSHAFHLPCIDRWLRSHVNCPLCRAPIVPPSSAGVPAPSPASPPMASDSLEPEPGSSEQVENIQIEGLPWESNIDGTETRIVIHESEGSSSPTASPEIQPSLPKPEGGGNRGRLSFPEISLSLSQVEMAGFLEACESKLVKLGWRKATSPPESPAGGEMSAEGCSARKEAVTATHEKMSRQRSGVSISEATMCMLLDRFAPS